MALRQVSVRSSGGDYSSLSAAEAGEQGDLVSLDRQLEILCYAMSDTTAVAVAGSTMDSTRYMHIIVPASDRHDGKWNTSKYSLEVSGAADVLLLDDEYTRVTGLQLSGAGGGSSYVVLNVARDACLVDKCIMRVIDTRNIAVQTSNGGYWGASEIRNSVIYDAVRWGILSSGLTTVRNCTIARSGRDGIVVWGSTCDCTNVASIYNNQEAGGYLDFAESGGTLNLSYCASSDGSADDQGGSGNRVNQPPAFVNESARDYHLTASDTALLDLGISQSSYYTDDGDGQTRSGSWDIGGDEYVAADSGMSASAACAASVSAALTTEIRLAASPACSAACSANLTTGITLSAAAACAASASAELTTSITLGAAASCSAACAAALTTAIDLSASTTCSGQASCNLTTVISLAGQVVCAATTSANITTAISLSASAACSASVAAELTTGSSMSSSASCSASVSAQLTTAIVMSASAACACSVSAALTTGSTLTASATCAASAAAQLTTQIHLAVAATGAASCSAALTTSIVFTASASASCSVSAVLTANAEQLVVAAARNVFYLDDYRRPLVIDRARRIFSFDSKRRALHA